MFITRWLFVIAAVSLTMLTLPILVLRELLWVDDSDIRESSTLG